MSVSNQKSKMSEYINSSKIIGIQFCMLSPEEMRKNSVVEVTSRDTYINNKPVIGGLFDPRMGVLEPGSICPTDGMTYIETPGYFGHIELATPVIFIQHIKEIMKILRCTCFHCGCCLIDKQKYKNDVLKKQNIERFQFVYHLASKVKRCGENTDNGCGSKQPDKITLEGMATINATWDNMGGGEDGENKKVVVKLTPAIILNKFKRISDDDVIFMGFSPKWSRPEWMICEVLPVPPPSVRPSVKHDAQQRSEDDLTHIYSNIIKTNNILLDKLQTVGTPSNVIEGWTTILQHSIAMIVNNKIKGVAPMAQRSGRPLQCIKDRIDGKTGRIRGNLLGKRVDFSARSVITGDPNLSITQLGVPLKIAKNLTKPVVVNDRNRDFLMALVKNGPDEYPGAKILEKKSGENISLRHVDRETIKLENGDIVHRHMMDNDAVLFNRQPSLHRQSMMCHIVKIMKVGDTFRMNVGDTKPYNADFDGDEMNLHMPQNMLAEIELRHLAAIPYQLITPTSNSPIIGIYQDSLLGSYRFTRPDIKMTPQDAMNLLMMFPNVDIEKLKKAGKKISSFDVLSQIFPPMTLMYKTKLFEDTEDYATSNNVLEIKNGKYVRGQLEKSVLGSATKGILHRICNDFGNKACANFNDNLQNIITEYMKTSSYSVGISDLIADDKTKQEIIKIITEQKEEVQEVIDKLHLGIFENKTSNTNMVEFENTVNNTLNKATDKSGKKGRESLSKDNRFINIVVSGSKGNFINISQMISCLGQQNVDGKRIPYGFDSRTLPHYNKFDDSPNARGFIENSYISGLTATELFFHAMGGRIGLIDTAVKTSQTGYIQRRLIKGLEDLKVEYDMTVRNSKGKIIQFKYGDDGFDSTKVENQIIPLVGMSIEDIYMHIEIPGINDNVDNQNATVFTKGTFSRMKKQKTQTLERCKKYIDFMISAREKVVKHVFKNKNDNIVNVPVSFTNIISNVQGQLELSKASSVDITPYEAFELIDHYLKKMNSYHFAKTNELFDILYLFYVNPRDLLIHRRFHQKGLVLLLETILMKFKEALVHPGEMVGVVAGQCIGEPTTQLTLNTFHLAGVASKGNVTRGVPRIEEILRLTNNPKNQSLTIYLNEIDQYDQEKANYYSKMLEHTKLIDVVKSIKICFDPNDDNTNVAEDKLLLEQFKEFENVMKECLNDGGENENDEITKSKWIIRLEMNAEELLYRNMTMDDIHFAISNSQYGEDMHCVFSDYNMDNLVFRIRINNKSSIFNKSKKRGEVSSLDQSDEIYLIKKFQENLLNNIVLRGIQGLKNVLPRKIQNYVVKEDGKYVKKDIWVLDTTGTNLSKIRECDFVDKKRTISNDIKEILRVYGMEAARQAILNELNEVMEFSDVHINHHHTSLLVDRMTCNKIEVPIFRTGLLNDNTGPIAKSGFEVHTDGLLAAARHGDLDHMRGVSAAVITGQKGNFGTASHGLVLDMSLMKTLENANVNLSDVDVEIEKMFGKNEEMMDVCSKQNLTMKNNIVNIKQMNNENVCLDDYDPGF